MASAEYKLWEETSLTRSRVKKWASCGVFMINSCTEKDSKSPRKRAWQEFVETWAVYLMLETGSETYRPNKLRKGDVASATHTKNLPGVVFFSVFIVASFQNLLT